MILLRKGFILLMGILVLCYLPFSGISQTVDTVNTLASIDERMGPKPSFFRYKARQHWFKVREEMRQDSILGLADTLHYVKEHKRHIKSHHNGMYTIEMENRDIRELFEDISYLSGTQFKYVGSIDQNVSISTSGFFLEYLIEEIAYEHNMLAVKNQNDYIIYGFGPSELLESLKINYLYNPVAMNHTKLIEQAERLGTEAKMHSFEEQNNIILTGTPAQIKSTIALLKQLDYSAPEITLEVMIVEFNHGKNYNWGIDISEATTGRLSDAAYNANKGLGFTYDFIKKLSPNFKVNLKALVERNQASVVTNPFLVATNNKQSTIDMTQTKFIQLTSASQHGISNELKQVKAPLNLKVTPIIMSDGKISLDIEGENTIFLPNLAEGAIETQKTSFKNEVTLVHGETFILGGLITEVEDNSTGGFPVLQHIPIVNLLFKQKANEKQYGETVIYITAYLNENAPTAKHEDLLKQSERINKRLMRNQRHNERKGFRRL